MADVFINTMNASERKFDEVKRTLAEKLPEITPQDLSGKVVIVTGANAGIGFETAKSIASMNPALLILACRNLGKAKTAASAIEQATGFKNIETSALDLASYKSVKNFAADFLARDLALDILVSNAGVSAGEWVETEDGHEIVLQVNHIANSLLVFLLTPALRKAKNPRIVIVASDTHFWSTRPSPDDPNPVTTTLANAPGNNFLRQYTSSKLFNVLFAKEYARRAPFPASICSSNPGYTKSELGLKDPKSAEPNGHTHTDLLEARETYEGAKTIIHNAIAPEIQNGAYYSEVRESRTRSDTTGEVGTRFAQNVWKDTIEILKTIVDGPLEDWIVA